MRWSWWADMPFLPAAIRCIKAQNRIFEELTGACHVDNYDNMI